MICHYWVFNQGVKFQDSVCNGCPDVTVFSINVDDIAIITVKNADCRCIIHKESVTLGNLKQLND